MLFFSKEKIALKAYLIAALVSSVFLAIALSFLYQYQKSIAIKLTNDISSKLVNIFVEHEDIADAITSKYTSSIKSGECDIPSVVYDHDKGEWHWSKDTPEYHQSSLFVSKKIDVNEKCLISSTIFVHDMLSRSDLPTKESFRYIISMKSKMFYFFNPIDTKYFSISDSKFFDNRSRYIPIIPNYYKRKLTYDITQKGTVSTPIYNDAITQESSYSLVSFVYDLNKSNSPVAYLFYDHSQEELRSLVHMNKSFRGDLWIKMVIQEEDSPNNICMLGCSMKTHDADFIFKVALSSQFKILSNVNILGSVYHSDTFKVLIALTVFIFIFMIKLTSGYLFRTEQYALVDHLTGLYSRKFEPKLTSKKLTGSFISIIDCNKFKVINDIHGHTVGDRVLQMIASVIQYTIRKEDIAIRYGGDEFLIILKAEHESDALQVMDRISREVSEKFIDVDGKIITTSISYGVSKFAYNLETSILMADKAMYKMKNQGT